MRIFNDVELITICQLIKEKMEKIEIDGIEKGSRAAFYVHLSVLKDKCEVLRDDIKKEEIK